MFVKIPHAMLGKPVRRVGVRGNVRFITSTSSEEMLVTAGNKVITFDKSGKELHSFTNKQLIEPTGVAVDGPNIYVADMSNDTLLKFDKTGQLLKSIGQKGSGEGEFESPI